MPFRHFLRRLFGGRLHADRLHLYRKYLFHSIQVSEHFTGGHVSNEDRIRTAERKAAELVEKQSREGITNPDYYFLVKDEAARWRAANRIFQRKQANKSRWLKEKRKNLLTLLQNRISAISQAENCTFAAAKRRKSAGSHRKK